MRFIVSDMTTREQQKIINAWTRGFSIDIASDKSGYSGWLLWDKPKTYDFISTKPTRGLLVNTAYHRVADRTWRVIRGLR